MKSVVTALALGIALAAAAPARAQDFPPPPGPADGPFQPFDPEIDTPLVELPPELLVPPECKCEGVDCSDDGCGPRWLFRAGAVLLTRQDPNSAAVLVDGTGAEVFNADRFDFDYERGPDFTIAHRTDCNTWVEFRWMGVTEWDDHRAFFTPRGVSIATNPPLGGGATPPPAAPPGLVTLVQAGYESDLDSFELGVRRRMNASWSLLAGLRYLDLDEEFTTFVSQPVPPITIAFDTLNRTDNDLFGGQIGVEHRTVLWASCGCPEGVPFLFEGPWELRTSAKAGALYNDADHEFAFSPRTTFGPPAVANDSDSTFSFLAELGLFLKIPLRGHWSFEGGYQFYWLDNLALATDQVRATNPAIPPAVGSGIDTDGELFLHGGNVAIVLKH